MNQSRTRGRGGAPALRPPQVLDVLSMLYPQQQIGLWGLDDNGLAQMKDRSRQQNHGVYSGTGVTLNQPGYRNTSSALFDGSAGYANMYSAGLAEDFNSQELTLAILMRMLNSGVWTDGALRFAVRIGADGNNFVQITKPTASNTLNLEHRAGGTAKANTVAGHADLDWFLLAMTVSVAADQAKAYKRSADAGARGMQIGSTLTGLGTWAGALNSGLCVLGGDDITPVSVHSGWLMGAALWTKAIPEVDLQAAGDALFG
jgi:hypothetical protein